MNDFHVPKFDVTRIHRERMLGQKSLVVWLYGLSGAGKSTLANALGVELHARRLLTMNLDGDILRHGINKDLGFSQADRAENLRRAAEVAHLALQVGSVVVCSFITPLNSMRSLVREIIGPDDLLDVFVRCSFDTCERRDVKGLYARAKANTLTHFTGKDSSFELPDVEPTLTIDTETTRIEECTTILLDTVLKRITRPISEKS